MDYIRYRSRAGERVQARLEKDGVHLIYRPGSAEEARLVITLDDLEHAVAVGELRSNDPR